MQMGDHILQVLLALGVVVGLVVALGYAMRRINGGHLKTGGDIRVVASQFLGPKERILLLEVKDRQIRQGVSRGRSDRRLMTAHYLCPMRKSVLPSSTPLCRRIP